MEGNRRGYLTMVCCIVPWASKVLEAIELVCLLVANARGA
jgi:hypothetical protein